MSPVSRCEQCGKRVLLADNDEVFDAPEKGVIEETAPGRPMMPDSLRLVVYGSTKIEVQPRNSRALYLHKHRCSRR